MDAVGGNFDFGNTAEGEQKLYEVYGWLFRGLFDNVTNRVGDRSLEHHTLGLEASQVHTHELARLEHRSCAKIVPLREVKYKPFPTGATGYPAVGPGGFGVIQGLASVQPQWRHGLA